MVPHYLNRGRFTFVCHTDGMRSIYRRDRGGSLELIATFWRYSSGEVWLTTPFEFKSGLTIKQLRARLRHAMRESIWK
jgi:hypothetical protein